jgi:hypothetical protein
MTGAAEIAELKAAILKLHGAKAEHVESVSVHETFQGQTVWDGTVEVFDLAGHASATRAYAWSHEGDSGGRRYVAVLHVPPVDSPVNAVRAAIVAEHRARTPG